MVAGGFEIETETVALGSIVTAVAFVEAVAVFGEQVDVATK